MAGPGAAPKDPAKRRRRNVDPHPTTILAVDDNVRGPELPPGYGWPSQTKRWWQTWRTSAQARTMTATDWDFMLDTALLHAALWNPTNAADGKLDKTVAAELRLRVAKFGATPEDRLRLRMQLEQPDQPPEEKPATRYGHLRAVDSG